MPNPFHRSLLALACANALLLTACGGDSSQADAGSYLESNDNPRAGSIAVGRDSGPDGAYSSFEGFSVSAGDNQQADNGVVVAFNGQVKLPEGHALVSLQWTQIAGKEVALQGATTSTLTIRAPQVDRVETLSFRLTAVDDKGNKASDTVSVVVTALKPFARVDTATANESERQVSLQVSLSELPSTPLSLGFEVQPITAQYGSDYSVASGQLSFAAGQRSATLVIPLLDDEVSEPTETFLVKLLANDTVGLTIATAVVTVLDDDALQPVAMRALIGPIAGAEVVVSDSLTQQVYCRTTTADAPDLGQAGRFTLPAECIRSGSPRVISISGGFSLDADENQQRDAEPTPLARGLHALVVPAATDFNRELNVSVITEAAYLRSTLQPLTAADAVEANLNQSARALLTQDLNGDEQITSADLLYWNPQADREKFKKSFELLDATKSAVLFGVESESEIAGLARRLWVDPIASVFADDDGAVQNAYRVWVTGLDENRIYYATENYLEGATRIATRAINFSEPHAVSTTPVVNIANGRPLVGLEAMAGHLVLRSSNNGIYGERLDLFPVAFQADSSVAEFDGLTGGEIYPIDYSSNGFIIGVPRYYQNSTGPFLRIAEIGMSGFNSNAAHPGSGLSLRSSAECPASNGTGTLIRPDNALYKVKVLNRTTVAAFYDSYCFYTNESATSFQHRVGIFNIDANNQFSRRNDIVLDQLSIEDESSDEVLDAVLDTSGTQLFVVQHDIGLRRVDLNNSAIAMLKPSLFASERYRVQTPLELGVSGNYLYELVSDLQQQGEGMTSQAIVYKYDISTATSSEVGSLAIEGAARCGMLNGLNNIAGRSMSVAEGNLVLSFAFEGFYQSENRYDYPGSFLFDAQDLIGDKSYQPDHSFSEYCDQFYD